MELITARLITNHYLSMDNKSKLETLLNDFNSYYNKNELEDWVKKPVLKFVKEKADFLLKNGIPTFYINAALGKKRTKSLLCGVATVPFYNETVFNAFREWLPEKVRTMLDALVWEERLHKDEAAKEYGINICTEVENYGRKLIRVKEEYKFLSMGRSSIWYNQTELALFTSLRRVMIDYYDKPEGAALNFLDEIEETKHLYNSGEQDILFEMPRLIAYGKQKQIKVSSKGKPNQTSLGKMKRTLTLKEFYKDSNEKILKTLRTHMLTGVLGNINLRSQKKEGADLVKALFNDYYLKTYLSLFGIVNYLKGVGHISEWYVHKSEQVFYDFCQELEVGRWVSRDNILSFFKFNLYEVNVISTGVSYDKLYYEYEEEERRHYYGNRHHIDKDSYYDALVKPVIEGTMFLFAAFGLLDIACDDVDVSVMGKSCYSPYEGLRYIRLTPLGSYVFKLSSFYNPPEITNNTSLELSKDSLTIIADESDTNAATLLQPYTERISPNRFRTEYSFFLKNCKTKKQLSDKIKLFRQIIVVDVPPYWENFFKELEAKIDPLQKASDIYVYKIPPENTVLINLIARDPDLKKYCMKGEGYHILIKKSHLSKFKNRLGSFGYLMT